MRRTAELLMRRAHCPPAAHHQAVPPPPRSGQGHSLQHCHVPLHPLPQMPQSSQHSRVQSSVHLGPMHRHRLHSKAPQLVQCLHVFLLHLSLDLLVCCLKLKAVLHYLKLGALPSCQKLEAQTHCARHEVPPSCQRPEGQVHYPRPRAPPSFQRLEGQTHCLRLKALPSFQRLEGQTHCAKQEVPPSCQRHAGLPLLNLLTQVRHQSSLAPLSKVHQHCAESAGPLHLSCLLQQMWCCAARSHQQRGSGRLGSRSTHAGVRKLGRPAGRRPSRWTRAGLLRPG